jgi:hypothetical protein
MFQSSIMAHHHRSMAASAGRLLLIFRVAHPFHLLPLPTSMYTSAHSLMRLLVAPFAVHLFPFSTESLIPLSGTTGLGLLISVASGELTRLPLAAPLIMMNPAVPQSSLTHGHLLTLQHKKHVSMFARVGARTYSSKLMLATCLWPLYVPFAKSRDPCHPQR